MYGWVVAGITCLAVSCEEEITYQSQLFLKNSTAQVMTVRLFPRADHMADGLYLYSEKEPVYREPQFDLPAAAEKGLVVSTMPDKKPERLLAEVFDSIQIKTSGKVIYTFSPKGSDGYPINPFTGNTGWAYRLRTYNQPTNLKKNPIESHDHIFVLTGEE
jgi:hypothetical protein